MRGERPEAESTTEGIWATVVEGMTVYRRCLADWSMWNRVPVVTVDQAIDLSLGVSPGQSHNCQPCEPVASRTALAQANIGWGCPIEVVPGSVDFSAREVDLSRARVRLTHFADWVVANGIELHPNCPRTTRSASSSVEPLGPRQESTLYAVIAMLALTVARRKLGQGGHAQPSVNGIAEAAIEAAEKAKSPQLLARSTLTQHIGRALREFQSK